MMGPNEAAANEKFVGKLVQINEDLLFQLEQSLLAVQPGDRPFDRFMVMEIIPYRDSDDDLIAVVACTVSGTGKARIFWTKLDQVVLA